MAKIVIELHDLTTVVRANLLIALIDDKLGDEFADEIREIKIE